MIDQGLHFRKYQRKQMKMTNNDLLRRCRTALSRLRRKMEELLALSEAFCSFLAALNCLVANSSAFALFGTTPR